MALTSGATLVLAMIDNAPARALGNLEWIPDGAEGTRVTMERMAMLATKGAQHPAVKSIAKRVVADANAAPGSLAALKALFAWVRDNIRFQADPAGIELLSWPHRTLEKRAEDCDGKATLLASMIRAIGHPARLAFRAIGTNPMRPDYFSHVYLVATSNGVTVPMDPTYRGTEFGWQYPGAVSVKDVTV